MFGGCYECFCKLSYHVAVYKATLDQGCCLYLQFFTATYILDAYPVHSASGTAASTLFRPILGGLAPIFSNKSHEQLDVGWAFSLLAIVALAVAPVPWIAYRFGERKTRGLR
ncbi:hypothetical protein M3J09_005701 [Ascochyta lentis]